jgi:hypothetical protein
MFLLLWRVFLSSCCFQKSVYSFSVCRLFSQVKVVHRLMQNSFIAEPLHGPSPTMCKQSMHKLCNFTFKQALQLLNCKYVQKPFGNVSSDLSMLQMGHWSHVQLVWNGLNVCQKKWQIHQGFNTNFMVLYFGVRGEKYHTEISSLLTEQKQIQEFIIYCNGQMKELLWRGANREDNRWTTTTVKLLHAIVLQILFDCCISNLELHPSALLVAEKIGVS